MNKLNAIFMIGSFVSVPAFAANHAKSSGTPHPKRDVIGENQLPSKDVTWEQTREVANTSASGVVKAIGCLANGRTEEYVNALQVAVKKVQPLGLNPPMHSRGRLSYESFLRAVAWDYLEKLPGCTSECYSALSASVADLFDTIRYADLVNEPYRSSATKLIESISTTIAKKAAPFRDKLKCEGARTVASTDDSTPAPTPEKVKEKAKDQPPHQRSADLPTPAPKTTEKAAQKPSEAAPAPTQVPPTSTQSSKGKCETKAYTIVNSEGKSFSVPKGGKTGKFPVESHLVTKQEKSSGRTPASSTDQIQAHMDESCAVLKAKFGLTDCSQIYRYKWHKKWTPAEGGGRVGQAKHAQPPDLMHEMFSFNMRWKPAPPPGTKFLMTLGDRKVVVVAGYEFGPNKGLEDDGFIGGIQPEVQYFLGAERHSQVKVEYLADQRTPIGPIRCQ